MTADTTRREFLQSGLLATAALAASATARAESKAKPKPRGKADACIMLWLGGGAAQVDTFDTKGRGDGKKRPGSYYDAIPTAIPGASVCEHLPRVARRLDRG